MKKGTLKKINKLLSKFAFLDKYNSTKLPLKNISDFKNVVFSTKDDLKNFKIDSYVSPVFNVTATSGTTASRLTVFHSRKCFKMHLRRVVKTYKSIGVKKGDLCLNICSYSLNSGGRIMEQAFMELGAGVIPYGIIKSKEELAEVVTLIKRLNPSVLNSYTNQLHDIFSLLKDKHNIKKSIVNGEPLFTSYRKEIEKLSGLRIYNNYGSMEFSGFAISNDSSGEYMRLYEDGLYFEVLKDNGKTAEVGKGKIVVTDLENHSMPFIRYVLGDLVEIVRTKKKKYIKVLGRTQDSIIINGIIYSNNEIIEIIQGILKHPNFFIVIDKDKVSYKDKIFINVLPQDKYKLNNAKSVIYKLLFIGSINVRIYRGNISKTTTGKFKHIIDLRKDA